MKHKKLVWFASAMVAGAAVVLLDSLILEKYFFEFRTYNIGPGNSTQKIKLILLTDLHIKDTLLPHYRRLAEKLNRLQPDLILITGDTIDSSGNIEYVHAFFDLLDQHIKKVAIPGNNDYKADPSLERLKKVYAAHNCDLLVNESAVYVFQGEKITITGLDDLLEGETNFRKAIAGIGSAAHHLLLIHSPLQLNLVKDEIAAVNSERSPDERINIRYAFAGHTHGGQVRLPYYVPFLPRAAGNYVNGWYKDNPPFLYVSRGFGTSTLPFRFFARSEVTLFNYSV